MGRHTVDINNNIKTTNTGGARSNTRSSSNDSAALRKTLNILTKALEDYSNKNKTAIEKALTKLVLEAARSAKGGSINKAEVSRIIKGASQSISNDIIKAISKSNTSPTSTAIGKDSLKGLENALNKSSEKMANTIANKVAKSFGVKIDTKELQQALTKTLSGIIPKSTGAAAKDVNSAIAAIKILSKDISALIKNISSMRSSGGGIDVAESSKTLSSLKKLGHDFNELRSEADRAKKSFAQFSKEIPDAIKDFNNAIGQIKRSTTMTVKGVGKTADTKVFLKEFSDSILKAMKQSGGKSENFVKAIQKLEKASGNLTEFVNEFKSIGKTFKRETASGKISIEGASNIIKELDAVAKKLGNLPEDIGFKDMPKQIQPLLDAIQKMSKAAGSFKAEVKLIVDDNQLKKALPSKIDVPVDLKPETKDLYSGIYRSVNKALRVAEATGVRPKVVPIIADFRKALEKKDVLAMQKDIEKLMSFDIDVSGLISGLKEVFDYFDGIEKKIASLKKSKLSLESPSQQKAESIVRQSLNRTTAKYTPLNVRDMSQYKARVVSPSQAGAVDHKASITAMSEEAQKIKAATESNIKRISSSLHNLQKQIVTSLDEQFKEAKSKWAVVKSPSEKDPTKAFSLSSGGRQWSVEIANLGRLQRVTSDFSSSVDVLVKNYKSRLIEENVNRTGGPDRMAELLGQWLKSVSVKEIKGSSGLDDIVKNKLINIKEGNQGVEVSKDMRKAIFSAFGRDSQIVNVFKKTYAKAEAERTLQSENFVKKIAIPAARVSETGDVSFQTVHGAQRAVPKFAKFMTGFEVLYKNLENMKKFDIAREFNERIKGVGVRPTGVAKKDAEDLATEMITAVANAQGGKGAAKQYVTGLYSGAAASKGFEIEKATGGKIKMAEFQAKVESAIRAFDTIPQSEQTFDEFSKRMKELNLTAYDAVRSLNRLEVSNVYDVIGDVIKGDKKTSPLGTIAKQPEYARSIREFEKAVREVEGLLPLDEANRPRRGYHQENVVNLLTRTGSFYDARKDRLTPDDQKRLIKDLNLEVTETLKKVAAIKGPEALPGGLRRATSLGIPEAQAGNVEEYRPGQKGGSKYLQTLNATSVKLYAEDLSSLAPFQQFQQAGRNIANVTNAMTNLKGYAETPKLRSEKERALIESGRYGQRGYGYNVTAELRNTAANFEDQIVISGKLADALTSAVKVLVKPGPGGRVRSGTSEGRITGTGVSEINAPQKLVDVNDVEAVTREYMKILGMPEEYKGRADKALIEAVEKTVSVVRGDTVEVQQAKLAETFMNYFGRKLTTRYGSKGVSITPSKQSSDMADILSKFGGKGVKIDAGATLGYQAAPKSLGKMAAELFGSDASKELKDRLIASGNKFMIDIFQNAQVVSADEAEKTKKLYEDFSAAWNKIFESTPAVGAQGVADIRQTYISEKGEKAAYELKPIDVRISSYGAAKRGLQTEFMESIFSNLAGTGAGGVTTLKQFKKPEYERFLKGGALSQYSEALGYKGAGKPAEEIAPELFAAFGGKGDYGKSLAAGDEKAVLAQKAAALESASTYYSTVIDEFGKMRKGLVGEKFLQIIEEPHINPEWQRGQIERGMKGARLNIPAFSAYSSVFGESSEMMKELQASLDINARKHWEYMKALQTIQDKDSNIYKNITEGLKKVDVGELEKFDYSTGTHGAGERSFSGSVLDVNKFPSAFMLQLPTGIKDQMEEMYVPGALARGTYPDPLIAGEHGMDEISRRLTHVVNMAKELSDVMKSPEQYFSSDDIKRNVAPKVASMVDEAWKLSKQNTPEAEASLQMLMEKLLPGLSTTQAPSPSLIPTYGQSEREYVEGFFAKQMQAAAAGDKSRGAAYATTLGTISDLLVGKKSGGTAEQMMAPTALTRAMDTGTIQQFTESLGIDVVQDTINKKVESLQKAKIDYYNSLAEASLGKTGSVNEVLFSRKIPAVMGKAVTAVVDKSKDLKIFQNRLRKIERKYGVNFEAQAKQLDIVAQEHGEAISGYQKIGVPVLQQEELGVPETFASKIPLEYIRKYDIKGRQGAVKTEPKKVQTTLLGLMKYAERLQKSASGMGDTQQQEIYKYIEDDLVPYIESIRFPFTGTSSIAPFKPKIISSEQFTDRGGRALSENALIVPGVPEGLQGLSPIIQELQDELGGLLSKREKMHEAGAPQEEIAGLTSLIRELNAAISDVIPKYNAQAQKLDFDGDQIEIHAAKTAGARKDIEAHFKRFHMADPNKDVRLQDEFMKRFLSEAAGDKTTGPYVFGEAQAAFEKKFPSGKGFEFMKSPFLTEQLEYMSTPQALDVLSGAKGADSPANMIEEVLRNINRPVEEIAPLLNDIQQLGKDSAGIVKVLEAYYSDEKRNQGEILDQIKSGIKAKLYEQKFGDTVEAQLFKVHTGMETEGMYRVHRLAETAAGFGGGLVGGQRKSSEYFKQRFPNTKAMGGNPEEEFHTMINEVLRFGIQKGMDVKHAGEKPVAGEMLGYLTKGVQGAGELWSRVQDPEDKTFGDLRDFAGDQEKAIRMRLGALPTSEILMEAKKITSSRGEDVSLGGATREELIKLIIEKVGFKGFLEEMALLIKKEAIEGLVAQAERWTPEKKSDMSLKREGLPPIKGDIRSWAEGVVDYEIGGKGINIRRDIMNAQTPMYGMRTYFASGAAEHKKYKDVYGDIAVPTEQISGIKNADVQKQYATKYKKAKAIAANIQNDLREFAGSPQTGAYADMIRGATDALYSQQDEIETYATMLKKEGYDPAAAKKVDVAKRVITREGVSSFANSVLNVRSGLTDEVDRLSDLAGVPGLSDTELRDLKIKTSATFAEAKREELKDSGLSESEVESEIKNFVDRMVGKAQALKQLDRVTEAILAKQNDRRVLQDLIPKTEKLPSMSAYAASQKEAFQEARTRISMERERRGTNYAQTMASGGAAGSPKLPAGGFGMLPTSGRPVPVHIVSADPSVTINIRGAVSAGLAPGTVGEMDPDIRSTVLSREDDDITRKMEGDVKAKAQKMAKKGMYGNLSPSELDKYLLPPKPAEGNAVKDVFENLKILHDQAKIYQKMKGLDFSDLSDMPKTIADSIGSVSEEGPDYKSFIELTTKLKEVDPENFSGKKFMDAWKAYRIAVGDWMIRTSENAYSRMRDFEAAGDVREANQAYGSFQKNVNRFQEFVRRGIGKRTDIYTEDKRFVYPNLAERAGVYMNPEQIMKKIGGPLGEGDPQLFETFQRITEGLKSTNMVAPVTSARQTFAELSDMKDDLVAILSDSEKMKRLGPEIIEAWDFDKLAVRVTRLREALQNILKQTGELDSEQKKSLEVQIKYLKNLEGLYSHLDTASTSDTGVIPVSKGTPINVQAAGHARNLQAVKAYLRRPEEEGGPAVGAPISYTEKIVDQAGQVVKNVRHDFKKYGEEVQASGQKVGQFSETQVDLVEKMQRVNASFGNAVRRVIMWGAASRLVYGGMSYLSRSLGELSEIETGMAQLRMVMNPLETDFNKVGKAATGFAKQYGVPVTDVLKSMKVFAQQGLRQEEVLDRTQTATLASNVTTLNAKEATEALTAAMKVFREEGDQSLRFLDAWSEVEARHAITAEDMANAIKKSAAAAKTAGFTFDQLNGIVAAIGATTRQSGKEIGTSFRFIARRLFSEEGPKALAKLPNPIATVTGSGELRSGFDVLSDLSTQWKDLTQAQKLNIAQSIGGTRQYNALLVLMDQWDEALRGIRNSTNSKGSAERRNLEIMKTYSKQMEQTKAAATELKMELGKVILPTFKTGLKALRFITESISEIPGPVKIAATGLLLLFGAFAKGVPIIDSIVQAISQGKSVFNQFGDSLASQMKMAKYEIAGKGTGEELFGLKTFSKGASPEGQVKSIKDLHSSLGKFVYIAKSAGDAYNSFLAGGAKTAEQASKSVENFGSKLSGFADKTDLATDLLQVGALFFPGIADDALIAGANVAEAFAKGFGFGIEKTGQALGKPAGAIAKFFGEKNPGLVKSVAPLAVSAAVVAPGLKVAYDKFQKLSGSAQDFEKKMDSLRKSNENQLKSVRDLIQSYDMLSDRVEDIKKAGDPETRERRMDLGTYEAPLVGMQKIQKDVTGLSNQLAEANLGLVAGYDKLGNAVLKSSGSFKSLLSQMESLKALKGVETEINILNKFVTDLTETEGPEKFKVAMKELAESFPVIGELLSRNIKIGPAKALEMASEDINKRISLKNKYPLSTAADDDIKKLQGVLKKAREAYADSYSDFEKVYKGVVSPNAFKGLDRKQIEKILTSPELRKAYELKLAIDPKFKLAGSKRAEDIMGKEVLTALNPSLAGILDVTKDFTKANLLTSGIKPREAARVYSGDLITIMTEAADAYGVAGSQAIVKLKETTDGVFKWVAEYFNTKTLKVEERSFSDLQPFVDSIFPVQKIQEDLSYRMDALNTFVSGASAGLVGLSAKDFKKDFNLGERFFSEIPTTTLLQGGFGFKPGAGYGQVPGAEGFGKDIQEFYFKPMDELQTRLSQLEKLKLEGIESGDVTLSKDMYDEINRLLTVLKNNQVVLQFRAVLVDLMKEFSESGRILKQNIAVIKERNKVDKETAGLMQGISKGIGDYDTGISKFSDLSPRQSLLRSSSSTRGLAQELKVLTTTSDSQLTQLDSIQKALVNAGDIKKVAEATGASLSRGRLGDFVEQVAKQADDDGPFKELFKLNTKVVDNTADTVDRLDKLLENQGDPETLERLMSSFSDNLGVGLFDRQPKKIANALERVAELRKSAEKSGNQEAVTAANVVLDKLSKKLLSEVGFKEGAKIIEDNFQLFKKDFKPEEFKQRAFGGVDTEVFFKKLGEQVSERETIFSKLSPFIGPDRVSVENSKEFRKIRKLQEKDGKETIFNTKNLAKVQAALAAASYVEKMGNSKIVKSLDEQVKKLDAQIEQEKEAGGTIESTGKLRNKKLVVEAERDKFQKEADFYGTVSAMNAAGLAANELGRAFGLTEGQVKALNLGAAGTYAAMKIASRVIGTEMPESAKAFEQELKKTAKKVISGEKPSGEELKTLRDAGANLTKDVSKRTKEIYGKSSDAIDEELKKKLKTTDISKYSVQAVRGAKAETGGTNRLQQAVVAYAAYGIADYVAKKTGERTELSTLESKMRDQQAALVAALDKYPDASERVLKDIFKERERAAATGGNTDVATITKSLVQDTDQEYRKVVDMINDYNKDIVKSHEETAKQIAEIQTELAHREIKEADSRTAYAAITAEKERRTLAAVNRKYSLKNIVQKGLGGFGGEFELPVPQNELSTQQRIYSESGAEFKKMLNAYADGTNQLDSMRKRIETLSSRMTEEAMIVSTAEDRGTVGKAKDRFKALSEELKNQIKVTDEYAEKLKEFANSYMYLERFSSAMYQFQNALRDIGIEEAVSRIPGVQKLTEELDKLLGGSSPNAIQAIMPEEERMGRRVGMDLRNLRSTRYDVEEARLRDQLRTATGQQATDIQQQLADLPERRRREFASREQQRYDEALKRSLSPFREQLTSLERVRTLPGLSSDMDSQISEYQKKIGQVLSRATERMPVADYMEELEANKAKLSEDAYNSEKKRVEQIQKAGIGTVYRGVPPWEKSGLLNEIPREKSGLLNEIPNEIRDAMKEASKVSGEGLTLEANVSDPIVSKLDETNAILKAIADKEFGLSFDKPSSFRKIFGDGGYTDLSSYMNKAVGGFVSGPGSSTSDSINAHLSDGEYVVKAASVQKIGVPKLNYMNNFGKVPGFAEGGSVGNDEDKSFGQKGLDFISDILQRMGIFQKKEATEKSAGSYFTKPKDKLKRDMAVFGGYASGGPVSKKSFIEYLKDERLRLAGTGVTKLSEGDMLGYLKDTGAMASLATTEIAGKVASAPIDLAKGAAGIYKYFSEKGLSGAMSDVSNIYGAAKEAGFGNVAKSVGKGILGALGEEVLSGGTGITAGVIAGLMGGAAKGFMKSSKAVEGLLPAALKGAPEKAATKSSFKLSMATNEKAMTKLYSKFDDRIAQLAKDNPALKKVNFVYPDEFDVVGGKIAEEQVNAVTDVIGTTNKYMKLAPGITDRKLSSIIMNQSPEDIKSTILGLSKKAKSGKATLGTYFPDYLGKKVEESFGISGSGELGGVIALEKSLFAASGKGFKRKAPSVAKHELGHALSANVKDIMFADEAVGGTLGLEKLTRAFKELEAGTASAIKSSSGLPSKYAYTNQSEAFAELFSVPSKKVSPVSESFDKFIEQAKQTNIGEDVAEYIGLKRQKRVLSLQKQRLKSKTISREDYDQFAADVLAKKVSFAQGGLIDKKEIGKWGLATLTNENAELLFNMRGAGPVDKNNLPDELKPYLSDSFMGIGAQYDTPIFRKALSRKRESAIMSEARKRGLEFAKSSGRRTQAREAGLANISGGVKADYAILGLDSRRNTVRLDDDPIAYQSKYALKEANIDASYNPSMGAKKSNGTRGTYYMSKLKKNKALAQKALAVKNISDEEKRLLQKNIERIDAVITGFNSGEDPLSSYFQKKALLALYGGNVETGQPMSLSSKTLFTKDSHSYKGLSAAILRRPLTGKSDGLGLTGFLSAIPNITSSAVKAITNAVPETTKEVLDMIKGISPGKSSSGNFFDSLKQLFNRSAEVMHNGGVVHNDGLVFAKGGEVFLPKGYADGGSYESATMALNTPVVKLDASDILSKLENIELKVEDKILKVEDKKLEVEDKKLEVETNSITVDVPDSIEVKRPDWKVEVDSSTITKIEVERPDWGVPVDVPTEAVKVSVDVGDAATRLSDAITTALNKTVEVEISGSTPNAVGGEKFNQLSETVSKVSDRLISVKTELEGKIKLLSASNNETTDIDRKITSILDNRLIGMQKDLNDMRTEVGSVSSTQRQKEVYYQAKIDELDYRLKNAMNITGIGTGGLIS